MKPSHPVANEQLLDWLRDAHAMEEQAQTMLSTMEGRLEHYPELRARISQHIDETKNQAELLRHCIQKRGGDASLLKDMAGRAMALMQGFSSAMASDEVIKGAMFSYAFEHLEIAAYRNLIATARYVDDAGTAQVCERILAEEEAMAAWLEEHMDTLTTQFLQTAGVAPGHAKR